MNGGILDFDFRSIRRSYTCSSKATIMNKRLGRDTCISGAFSNSQMPNPPLTLQTKLDACIQTFLGVSTLYRVGGGEGGRPAKGSTVLWVNPKIYRKILILHYSPKNFCL